MAGRCGRIAPVRILVTGGTGTLGSSIVSQLGIRGHEAVVGSRTAGPDRVAIDLATGSGISSAVAGVDAIVHAASDPARHAKVTDVSGTVHLAKTGLPVLYTSIMGVDRHPFRYYQIKREGELALAANSVQWTVLRATQFHSFIDYLLSASKNAASKIPGNRGDETRFPASRGLKFQPVAHEEVASQIVDLLESGPTNSIEKFAGPQQFDSEELTQSWAQARGGRPFFVPTAGKVAKAFKDGAVLAGPEVPVGSTTWADYLLQTG